MPNFDRNGSLKQGRVIGRGRGPCSRCAEKCSRKDTEQESRHGNGLPAQ
jgi:hypothetical protein